MPEDGQTLGINVPDSENHKACSHLQGGPREKQLNLEETRLSKESPNANGECFNGAVKSKEHLSLFLFPPERRLAGKTRLRADRRLPMPLDYRRRVEVNLEQDGKLTVIGSSLRVELLGQPKYVEEFLGQ